MYYKPILEYGLLDLKNTVPERINIILAFIALFVLSFTTVMIGRDMINTFSDIYYGIELKVIFTIFSLLLLTEVIQMVKIFFEEDYRIPIRYMLYILLTTFAKDIFLYPEKTYFYLGASLLTFICLILYSIFIYFQNKNKIKDIEIYRKEELVRIEIKKANELAEIEIKKANELAKIEIEKARKSANI